MIEQCIELINALPVVKYGQAVVIGTGLLVGVLVAIVYRLKTKDRKYRE